MELILELLIDLSITCHEIARRDRGGIHVLSSLYLIPMSAVIVPRLRHMTLCYLSTPCETDVSDTYSASIGCNLHGSASDINLASHSIFQTTKCCLSAVRHASKLGNSPLLALEVPLSSCQEATVRACSGLVNISRISTRLCEVPTRRTSTQSAT